MHSSLSQRHVHGKAFMPVRCATVRAGSRTYDVPVMLMAVTVNVQLLPGKADM